MNDDYVNDSLSKNLNDTNLPLGSTLVSNTLNSNILNERKTNCCKGKYIRNMKYIGMLEDVFLFVQLNAFLLKCDYKKLFVLYFLQKLNGRKFKTIVVDCKFKPLEIEKNHTFLNKYQIRVVGDKIQFPIIKKNIIPNIETKFNNLTEETLAECFYELVKNYESFFNMVKKNINENNNTLECFTIVTSLNDLYKAFKET